ncbi:VCBS repeat-containing protein [candidate division WOR-3 bacterium]|nr:VCBS repeat-containing protein [candidate division WOR-3 bacterium]
MNASVFIIKAAGNDSFYVWETLPGNDGGSSIAIYDIDGNGLAEIVISGNNQTRIYEYQVGIAETAGAVVQPIKLEIFLIRSRARQKCAARFLSLDT